MRCGPRFRDKQERQTKLQLTFKRVVFFRLIIYALCKLRVSCPILMFFFPLRHRITRQTVQRHCLFIGPGCIEEQPQTRMTQNNFISHKSVLWPYYKQVELKGRFSVLLRSLQTSKHKVYAKAYPLTALSAMTCCAERTFVLYAFLLTC